MIKSFQCIDCKHYQGRRPEGGYRCDAYPDRIPNPIVFGDHDHTKPYRGDRGVLFEPKEKETGKVAT